MVSLAAVDGRFEYAAMGWLDLRVNAFLSSARGCVRRLATLNRDYAQSLCLWLNFLERVGCGMV